MHRGFSTAVLFSCAVAPGCGGRLGILRPAAPFEVRLAPGEEVVLDGSGSFDPEGEELSFRWRQVAGPEVELRDAGTPWPRFVPRRPGRYEFELVVCAPPPGAVGTTALSARPGPSPGISSGGDNEGVSDPVRLVVNVLPPNRPPVVDIDEEIRAEPGQWAALDGGRVTDPDGDVLDFEWRQIAGDELEMEPAGGRARQVLVRSWRAGEFRFELTVRDSVGAESRGQLRLMVAPNDRPPIAIPRLRAPEGALWHHYPVHLTAWPHRTGGADSRPVAAALARTCEVDGYVEVTLDATGSYDPDGDDLEFRWKQTGGPHVRVLHPDAEKGLAVTSFDAPAEGLYGFRLVVSDGVLKSSPADVQVAVGRRAAGAASSPTPQHGPDPGLAQGGLGFDVTGPGRASGDQAAAGLSANAGPDVFGEVGRELALSGSVDAARDRDGTRFLYEWRQVAGPRIRSFRVPSMAESARPRFVPGEPGRYVLTLRVSEDGARWSRPDLVTATVLAANRPPRLVVPEFVTARAGYLVTVAASCGDPDGDAVEIGWRVVAGEAREIALDSDGPVATFCAPERGHAVVECVARDSRGGETRARVRVEARAGGLSPVASARAPAVARPGERVVLDGTGSFDPEGEPLEFRWEADSIVEESPAKLIVKLERTGRPRAVFRPSAPGRYGFRLVVRAGGRTSAPAHVAVEVKEPQGAGDGALGFALKVAPVRTHVGAGRPVVLCAHGTEGRAVSWRQIEGPEIEGLRTVDGRAVVRPEQPGRYAFLPVYGRTDKGGPFARAVRFVVSESNARPVVKARARFSGRRTSVGPDLPGRVVPVCPTGRRTSVGPDLPGRGSVLLDGTGSFDPEGVPLRFRWLQVEGPALDLASFPANAPRVRLERMPPGRYAVRLIVTDGERVARSKILRFEVQGDLEKPEGRESG